MTPRARQVAEAAVGGVQAPALLTSAVSGTENVGAGASTSTPLTPSVPLTKLLRGGGLTTALLLLALTTTGATPLCNSATSSTTAYAASATSSTSATTVSQIGKDGNIASGWTRMKRNCKVPKMKTWVEAKWPPSLVMYLGIGIRSCLASIQSAALS
ncbi:unnamed protein product [Closterium sp. NIES-54]